MKNHEILVKVENLKLPFATIVWKKGIGNALNELNFRRPFATTAQNKGTGNTQTAQNFHRFNCLVYS